MEICEVDLYELNKKGWAFIFNRSNRKIYRVFLSKVDNMRGFWHIVLSDYFEDYLYPTLTESSLFELEFGFNLKFIDPRRLND